MSSLPQLAWCAKIIKGSSQVELFHGRGVEVRANAFVEGAWDGDFDEFQFVDSCVRCGTGGYADDEHLYLAGSTDRSSPLVSIEHEGTLYVSNSLLLLMTLTGEKPDSSYPYYAYDIVKIWRLGLHCLSGTLPLDSGNELRLHLGAQMTVGRGGEMTMSLSSPGQEPTNYHDYRAGLADSVTQVLSNAQSPLRKKLYRPIAAISKGYDSTATAVLARDSGCTESVSLLDSREDDPYVDSGRENSERLGMQCHEVDRWKFHGLDTETIAELSMFGLATSAPIAGFETLLEGRVFITGQFGDTILDIERAACAGENAQSWARFASGLGALEFRLRVGYVGFAPLFVMARHNNTIHALSHSKEMQPWFVEGSYNRPIARRIIEDAGIPRECFALRQRGGGHAHFQPKPKKHKPAQSIEEYRDYVAKIHSIAPPLRLNRWKQRVKFDRLQWTLLGPSSRALVKISYWQKRFPFLFNSPPLLLDWPYMFTFQWSHSLLSHRYAIHDKTGLPN